MKTLIAFFASNWGLKLLALVLAIAVYYSMKDTSRTRQSRSNSSSQTPMFLKGPADGGK
ncbi:MAG: hypothetical protein MJ240_03105 [Kiritimatiellae bacterium]|nr:hypothetical protein [Kiritimatiellia bacterium]